MEGKRIPVRTDREILKQAQKSRHVTQDVIAEKMDIKRASLCQSMNRSRMSLGMFAKILDVLGYDVIVADQETGEIAWKLEVEKQQGELDDDI